MAQNGTADAARVSLDTTDITPIAQLDTMHPPPSQTHIRAVVALIYPFSSRTQTAAVLLADPDMRQRSRKGQVRVQFHGPAGIAFGHSKIGSGDELLLRLEGARWVEEDKSAVHTPGRSVDAELCYDRRLVLQATRETSIHAWLDVDAPISPPRPQSSSNGGGDSEAGSSPPAPAAVTPALSRAKSRMNLGYDAFENNLTPIVYDDENYDPFLVEDDGRQARKRTKLGRKSGEWRLVGWGEEPSASIADSEKLPETPVPQRQKRLPALDVDDLITTTPGAAVVDLISPEASSGFPPAFNVTKQLNNQETHDQPDARLNGLQEDTADLETTTMTRSGLLLVDDDYGHSAQQDQYPPSDEFQDIPMQDQSILEDIPPVQPTSAATVEPLFGPNVPTAASKTPNLSEQVGGDIPSSLVEEQDSTRQTFTESFFDPSHPTGQVSLDQQRFQSDIHSLDIASSALPETQDSPVMPQPEMQDGPVMPQPEMQDSPVMPRPETQDGPVMPRPETQDGPVMSQPDTMHKLTQDSDGFVQPSTPASSFRPRMEMSMPESPFLQPMPSQNLPLISPFPASPSGSSLLPASTADSFRPPAASTPSTSQSIPQSQDEQSVNAEKDEQVSALIPDPGAPPDTTLIADELVDEPDNLQIDTSGTSQHPSHDTIVIDESPQHTSNNKFEQTDATAPQMPSQGPYSNFIRGNVPAVEDAESPKLSLTVSEMAQPSQFDGANDERISTIDFAEKTANLDKSQDPADKTSPLSYDSAHLTSKEITQDQDAAQRKVDDPVKQSGTAAHAASHDEPTKQTNGGDHLIGSEAMFTPINGRRQTTVPESLSPFFEVVPPRRSGRQTKPTEKVRMEKKGSISGPPSPIVLKSPSTARSDTQLPVETDHLTGKAWKPPSPITERHPQLSITQHVIGSATEALADPAQASATEENPLSVTGQDEAIALVKSREKGFRTSLSYYAALQNIDVYLNASSSDNQGSLFDVFAVVTQESSPVVRAKSGPKHHYTVLHLSDASSRQETQVECFRPRKDALPVASKGDVMLLRQPLVKSRDGKPFLISGSASAWHVWRFDDTTGPGQEKRVNEECRGPQVELGEEEQQHAHALRRWWVVNQQEWLMSSKSAKTTNHRRDKSGGSIGKGQTNKKNKGKHKRS